MKGWSKKSTTTLQKVGRPTILSRQEEDTLLSAVHSVRNTGAVLDREAMQAMGKAVADPMMLPCQQGGQEVFCEETGSFA